MADHKLLSPGPVLDGPYQPGITSPAWPPLAPKGVDPKIYAEQYAGQIDRQRFCHILFADVTAASCAELKELLTELTSVAHEEMQKPPTQSERSLDATVPNRRVSITVGFGASLFTARHGDDRFGLAALRPRHLKVIPKIHGDKDFDPTHEVTDLIIIVASDDMYVNEYIFGLILYGNVHPAITVRRLERGYSRPDSREPSGFEDGISNPRVGADIDAAEQFVYVRPGDGEPQWCHDGTYLAYRKIGRGLRGFFKLSDAKQAAVFGVDPKTGARLPGVRADAHAPKINPRRPGEDLFGTRDGARHFLRRPYFFDDGMNTAGEEIRGVHHLSFVRHLTEQYEWPVLMWQTNRDFPHKGAGVDELYESGGAANLSAGYYFMPAAAAAGSYIGAGLLDS